MGSQRYRVEGTEVLVYYGEPSPYSMAQEIYMDLLSMEKYIDSGIWKILLNQPVLVIFAEGKLDSKRRLVKLLKRDAQIIEATTPKEQDLKRYFSGQAQELGLHFVGDSLDQLLLKSGYDFGKSYRRISLCCRLIKKMVRLPPRYQGGCSKVLAR